MYFKKASLTLCLLRRTHLSLEESFFTSQEQQSKVTKKSEHFYLYGPNMHYETAILVIFGLLVVHTCMAIENDIAEDTPAKRGFGSYFSNSYYDEIAMSVCASLPIKANGHVFPVRRRCGSKSKQTCAQLCRSVGVRRQTTWMGNFPLRCIESLHIYKGRPLLASNPGANTDVGKISLVTYRYNTCRAFGCGPNYCCCRKGR